MRLNSGLWMKYRSFKKSWLFSWKIYRILIEWIDNGGICWETTKTKSLFHRFDEKDNFFKNFIQKIWNFRQNWTTSNQNKKFETKQWKFRTEIEKLKRNPVDLIWCVSSFKTAKLRRDFVKSDETRPKSNSLFNGSNFVEGKIVVD